MNILQMPILYIVAGSVSVGFILGFVIAMWQSRSIIHRSLTAAETLLAQRDEAIALREQEIKEFMSHVLIVPNLEKLKEVTGHE